MRYKDTLSNTIAIVVECQVIPAVSIDGSDLSNVHLPTYVVRATLEFVEVTIQSEKAYAVGEEIDVRYNDVLDIEMREWGGFEEFIAMLEQHGHFIPNESNQFISSGEGVVDPFQKWTFEFESETPDLFKILLKPFIYSVGYFMTLSFEGEKVTHARNLTNIANLNSRYYDFVMTHERLRWILEKGVSVRRHIKWHRFRYGLRETLLTSLVDISG